MPGGWCGGSSTTRGESNAAYTFLTSLNAANFLTGCYGEHMRRHQDIADGIDQAISAAQRSGMSRRAFVNLAAAGGVGIIFGFDPRERVVAALIAGSAPASFAPNQWLTIDQRGRIVIRAHKSEMGQGVRTALPAIVAAELGADCSLVTVVHAEPGPEFPDMGTSGSSSVSDSWRLLRTAAAAARTVLVLAAAQRWRVPPAECEAQGGFVIHRSSRRRTSFGSLVADAARIPIPGRVELRPESELLPIGTRLRRVDTPAIVRGRATYGIDVRVPGMRFAVIARPPKLGAVARQSNEGAARRVVGVESVVQTPSGIAVVARNTWAAIQGRAALNVEWDESTDATRSSAAFIDRLEGALDNGRVARREGDFAAALAGAATHLDATYRAPFQAHAALEPLSCVADVRADRCEIWVGTQRPNGIKALAATMLNMPSASVTVHVTLIGGAFGRRIAIDHAREAIELSKAINAPVQVVWTREDDFAHDMYQPAQVNRLAAAVDTTGTIVGWRHQVSDYHLSMFGPFDPKANPGDDGDPWGGYDTPYIFPALEVTLAELEAPVPTGAWRSVAYPAAVFARECFIDEVAHATNRDPLSLRLALLSGTPSASPMRNAQRTAARLRNVLQLAADRAGWRRPLTQTSDGRRWGRGIACNPYGSSAMVAQVVEASVGSAGDIRVHRVVTAIDVGRVIDRSGLEAQVEGGVGWALSAALKTEITFANGRAEQSNYDRFPVLRMREMPTQEIVVVESDIGPFGAGEPPVPAVYAALGNALFAATGERLRTTPFRNMLGEKIK